MVKWYRSLLNALINQRPVSHPATKPTGMAAATSSVFSAVMIRASVETRPPAERSVASSTGSFRRVHRQGVEQDDDGEHGAEQQHDANDGVEEPEELADGFLASPGVAERDDARKRGER